MAQVTAQHGNKGTPTQKVSSRRMRRITQAAATATPKVDHRVIVSHINETRRMNEKVSPTQSLGALYDEDGKPVWSLYDVTIITVVTGFVLCLAVPIIASITGSDVRFWSALIIGVYLLAVIGLAIAAFIKSRK